MTPRINIINPISTSVIAFTSGKEDPSSNPGMMFKGLFKAL
jgi:hypothetical protein